MNTLFRVAMCKNLPGLVPEAGQMYTEAGNYFIGITIWFPAINLVLFLISYMQVNNDRNRALLATIILTATDVAGDFLSAKVLHAGMLGMGLATSVSYYLVLLVLLLHFRKRTFSSNLDSKIFHGVFQPGGMEQDT